MILEINNLNKVIARVNGGSGVVLKFESDKKCYVLTAYHNIEDSIENDEKIDLLNDENKPYTLVGKPYCDIKNDFALLEIEYINKDIPIVKYDKNISPDDKIIFMGYPDKGEKKRKDLSGKVNEWNRTKTSIKVLEENIQGSFFVKEKANEVIVGFSGSGVFKKDGQKLSLIGILKSLPEEDFDYKEISCVPIEKILEFIQDNELGILFFLAEKKILNQVWIKILKFKKWLFMLFILLLLIVSLINKQSYINIKGIVKDENGTLIKNAKIIISNYYLESLTNDKGEFAFEDETINIEEGEKEDIQITARGYCNKYKKVDLSNKKIIKIYLTRKKE